MKRWILLLTLLLAAIPVAVLAGGDPTVTAQVDRTTVAPGESLELTVTIHDGEGEVALSGLTDFKVFSQGTSSSLQIINGSTSRQETHNYVLIPQRQGRLAIPALKVKVNGRELLTEPITITVSAQPSPDSAGEAQEVWVETAVSDPRPYVGQQITFTFSFYQSVQVTDATFQAPDFKGFTAKEIKERGSERKVINGREYAVTRIYYVLIPQEAGRHAIEPAALQLGIVRPDARQRRSPFDDFFNDPRFGRNRVEPKVLQSNALDLDVRALPPWQGSEPFSGLVGRFELTAEMEKSQLKVGDSATLSITVQGQGNIVDAQAPALQVPDAFKSYADTPQEEIQVAQAGFSGKKVFRIALVPVKAGQVALPPVHLTYFDVEQQNYRTLSAALPMVQVLPADQAEAAPITAGAKPRQAQKQQVEFTGRDILPLKEGLEALQAQRPLAWPLFLLWISAPAMAFFALLLIQRLYRPDAGPAARMRTRAQQALKSARQCAQDPPAFLTALYQALTAAIYFRAGRSGEALTWSEAEVLLLSHGTDPDTARQAADLLTAIESSKFSGAQLTADQRDDLLARTQKMVARLAP